MVADDVDNGGDYGAIVDVDGDSGADGHDDYVFFSVARGLRQMTVTKLPTMHKDGHVTALGVNTVVDGPPHAKMVPTPTDEACLFEDGCYTGRRASTRGFI